MLRSLLDRKIEPGSFTFTVIFQFARFLYRVRALRPNTKIHYIKLDGQVIVLTPLAGSSSIRAAVDKVELLDVATSTTDFDGLEIVIMDRPFADRMQSFYNKKVRNPTNIGKAITLATCSPLKFDSSVEEFYEFLQIKRTTTIKDKHLFTIDQIARAFGCEGGSVRKLRIDRHKAELEEMLGEIPIERVNSTQTVSLFSEPVILDKSMIESAYE